MGGKKAAHSREKNIAIPPRLSKNPSIMLQHFLAAFGLSFMAMFPIINPIGHAPMFYAMTQDDTLAFRRRIATRTAIYTTLILLLSLLVGEYILLFFGVTLNDLRIAGGLLVSAAAWGMLSNKSRITTTEHAAAVDKEDISLTPMATPILAGPGAMSLAIGLLTYGRTTFHYGGYIAGFLAIGTLTWVCLYYSDQFARVLSVNAMGALNRILGLFILSIGVNLITVGLQGIFFSHTPAVAP